MAPKWKKLMKNVDLDEATSFLDHVCLGCTQRECRPNEIVIEKYKEMFESRISAGAMEKLPGWAKPHAKNWNVVLRHARTCSKMHGKVSRIGEKTEQLYKVSSPCLDDHQITKGRAWISWRMIGSMHTICLKMLVRGQNWLTRHSVVSQQTCPIYHKVDSSLWQTFGQTTFLHPSHTRDYRQYCHVGKHSTTLSIGVISGLWFLLEIFKIRNQHLEEFCVFLVLAHLRPSVGCARSKLQYHTVPQNLKLYHWMLDCAWTVYLLFICGTLQWRCCVRRKVMQTPMVPSLRETGARPKITPKPKQKTTKHVDLSKKDQVPVNADSSRGESQLCIFEINEPVIKMIIKGRSPTMRHVSRTHRVALDWLFDKINLDPKIQIKNMDTKNQMADMLTKSSFTRDEWNHLLHLLNIMNFSTFSRSHFFRSNRKQSVVMSKRSQEGLSHDSPTVKAKPRPRAMNLVSHRNLSILRQSSQKKKTEWFWIPGE